MSMDGVRFMDLFQSTFPRGERPVDALFVLGLIPCFNPRSREGNDKQIQTHGGQRSMFQSTFPRGERHRVRQRRLPRVLFQSTFPRGERQQSSTIFTYRSCSFLCNYTNICFSIQVIPLITSLFPSIFHS